MTFTPQGTSAPVPSGVWEALQRLIENAATLGPASQQDALLVAQWRGQFTCGVQASECIWPTKPLKLVQVTLPDGTSAALPPERAYFDAWSVQELENKLKAAHGVQEVPRG